MPIAFVVLFVFNAVAMVAWFVGANFLRAGWDRIRPPKREPGNGPHPPPPGGYPTGMRNVTRSTAGCASSHTPSPSMNM